MNLLSLFGLAKSELPKPSPEQIRASRRRLERFDKECAQRELKRKPTQEQLNRVIDL